jgi:hypothetical protein
VVCSITYHAFRVGDEQESPSAEQAGRETQKTSTASPVSTRLFLLDHALTFCAAFSQCTSDAFLRSDKDALRTVYTIALAFRIILTRLHSLIGNSDGAVNSATPGTVTALEPTTVQGSHASDSVEQLRNDCAYLWPKKRSLHALL